jgi:hypothetical protein
MHKLVCEQSGAMLLLCSCPAHADCLCQKRQEQNLLSDPALILVQCDTQICEILGCGFGNDQIQFDFWLSPPLGFSGFCKDNTMWQAVQSH